MKYLCLIYADEVSREQRSKSESDKIFDEYVEFTKSVQRNGNFLGANPLQPTRTATTVRVRNGKTLTTDGPFAETKEQLGGYYLVEAKNLEEAIGIAARIPTARFGSIEVRPIMELPAQVQRTLAAVE